MSDADVKYYLYSEPEQRPLYDAEGGLYLFEDKKIAELQAKCCWHQYNGCCPLAVFSDGDLKDGWDTENPVKVIEIKRG